MRRTLVMTLVTVLTASIAACGGGGRDPKAVCAHAKEIRRLVSQIQHAKTAADKQAILEAMYRTSNAALDALPPVYAADAELYRRGLIPPSGPVPIEPVPPGDMTDGPPPGFEPGARDANAADERINEYVKAQCGMRLSTDQDGRAPAADPSG